MADQVDHVNPTVPNRIGGRQQVTALFYDIVNSTNLLGVLDPEDFGTAQRLIHIAAAEAISRHGGAVDQIVGDGGCAYFGYPVASEDAAEGAVAAALAVIESCGMSGQTAGLAVPLQVRVGVATGSVVVRDGVHWGRSGGAEIIGLAPNLAARLQAMAAPNSAVVADSTYVLTSSAFDFEPLGTAEIKGLDSPQRLWRPLSKRSVDLRYETRRGSKGALLAREEELGLCRRLWARAVEGHGAAVFITGEAGIGKSRLVSELLREAKEGAGDHRVLQCQPRGTGRMLHPLLDRIRRDLEGAGDLRYDAVGIRDYLRANGARAETADLFSFLSEAEPDLRSRHPDLAALEFRKAAVEAAMDLVSAWCRVQPTLLVIEDFHWADALTRALLLPLATMAGRLPLMVLVTSREPIPPDYANDDTATRIVLRRLDPAAVPTLVQSVWSAAPMPKGLAEFVEFRTEGVPLFVEELTFLLRDRFGEESSGVADWEQVLRKDGVTSLKDLLTARIASLGETGPLAQVASVIGREFPYDLLARLVDDDVRPRMDRGLASLLDQNVIQPTDKANQLTFRFRHSLLQDAAYDSLLKAKRRELHDRIVTLVRDSPDADIPDEVMAWHCEQAGRLREAALFAIKAAEACSIRSAVSEAHRLLSTAEAFLADSAGEPDRDELILRLLATLGPIVMALYGDASHEARSVYERAIGILRTKTPREREAWFALYWGWWMTAPTSEALTRSKIILADHASPADPEIKLQALHCSWATHFHAGQHAECLGCIEQGLELYDPQRASESRTKYGGHDARVCGLAERGLSLWLTGHAGAAAESAGAALDWAEASEHIGSICHALDVSLILHHLSGERARVLALASRLRGLAEANGLQSALAKSEIYTGWASAMAGSMADSLVQFERGLRLQTEIGTEEDLPLYLSMRAALLEMSGEIGQALSAIEAALEQAKGTNNAVWLPMLHHRHALLRARSGEDGRSVQAELEDALALARSQGVTAWAARISDDLARHTGRSLSQS